MVLFGEAEITAFGSRGVWAGVLYYCPFYVVGDVFVF